jgi:hypothetical protein
VGIFGLGFPGKYISAKLAMILIAKLRDVSASYGGITVFAGVPSGWRTLTRDADSDPGWTRVYQQVDVISPWSVGRFGTQAEVDSFRTKVLGPDLAEARRLHEDYMPVVFPGFSWHNLMDSRGKGAQLNQIPRECGKFYWHQIYNAVDAGSSMVFTAMFDEVDEGTAIYKTVPDQIALPASPPFLALDADGCNLPSDWYLRLAGAASSVLGGRLANTDKMPIQPMKR